MSDARPAPASPARQPLASDVAATLALVAFSCAVAAGYARVFSGWQFMGDLVTIAVVGHGCSLMLRRGRVAGWLAVPAMCAVVVWLIAFTYYGSTFSWGLPTTETWTVFRLELTSVREQFRTAVAPVNYGGGWDVLAAIGLGLAVVLADVFAFRALARAETLVPGGVLFIFVGALGDDRLRVALTVVLVGVGVLTTVVLRAVHSPDAGRRGTSPLRRVVPAAVAAAVVVAVVAGYVGPRLPGADAAPLYETRGGGGGVTEVISPLVDIRSRLTNRSDAELFQVRADVESYWRSSALSEFDGTIWGLPDEQDLESSGADLGTTTPTDGVPNRQQITIVDLGGVLVPAAPEPVQASGLSDLRWVAETSTLVTVDGDLDEGDVIDVVSVAPQLDAPTLEAATSDSPGGAVYTRVPDDLPSVVRETAAQVTAGARTTYEAARLLQGWFQREFDYSLEVQAGHGNNAIETFLRERIGYCEQFAGTYAAMMRTLGHPARVAVGFTSGTSIGENDYSVLGRNAHAWPEVWFDGIGWVGFEPTPGRGAPNAEAYTGLPPQQDTATPEPALDGDDDEAAPTTTVAGAGVGNEESPLNLPEEFADPTGATDEPVAQEGDGGADLRPFLAVLVLLLVALAPAVIRRVRARTVGASVDAQLARMWTHAVDAVAAAGVPIRASNTPLETADATALHLPIVARPMSELARTITEAMYRPEGTAGFDTVGTYGSSTLRNCHNWSRQITRAVDDSTTFGSRVRRYFTIWT